MVIGREMTLTGRSLEYQTTLNSLVRYIKLIYLEIFSPYMALILVIVHVGDIKKSSDDCVNFFYNNTATELKKSSSTVFIIPGDNDWIECDNTTHGIALWENSFVTFHKNWENITTDLPIVSTQSMHPENFSFIHKDVIFIGINLINNVSDEISWNEMAKNDVKWLVQSVFEYSNSKAVVIFTHLPPKRKYSAFFAPLNKLASISGLPFLLIHGNGHRWIKDKPFTSNNILRVQVSRGKNEDPVRVSVDTRVNETMASSDGPFSFFRRFAPTTSPTQSSSYQPSTSLTLAPIWSTVFGLGYRGR